MLVAQADLGGGVKKKTTSTTSTTTSTTSTTKTTTTSQTQGTFWTKIADQIKTNIENNSKIISEGLKTLSEISKNASKKDDKDTTTTTTTTTTKKDNTQKKNTYKPTNTTDPTPPVKPTQDQPSPEVDTKADIGTPAVKEVIPTEMVTRFNDLKTKWLEYNSNAKYDLDKYYEVLKDYNNKGVADKVDSTLGELDDSIKSLNNDMNQSMNINSSTINSFQGIMDILEGEILSARRMMTECLIPIDDRIFTLKELLIERKTYKEESVFDSSSYISKVSQIESELKTAYTSYKATLGMLYNGMEVNPITYEEVQVDQNYPINKRITMINNMQTNLEIAYSKNVTSKGGSEGVSTIGNSKFSEARGTLNNILYNLKTIRSQFPFVDLNQIDVNSLNLSGLTDINSSLNNAVTALAKVNEIEQQCVDIINSIVKKNEEYPFDLKCISVDRGSSRSFDLKY